MFIVKVWHKDEAWFAHVATPMSPSQFDSYTEEFPDVDILVSSILDKDDLEYESEFAKLRNLYAM